MKFQCLRRPFLALLILLSVFQTAGLWFDDVSSRNFFYNFLDKQNKEGISEILDGESTLMDPINLTVYNPQSDQFYMVKKTRAEYSNLLSVCRRYLQQMLFSGNNKGITIIDWQAVWSDQSIVMDLPFYMTIDMLTDDLNVVKSIDDSDYSFNSIIIIPSNKYTAKSKCYLVNTEMEQELLIELDSKNLEYINAGLFELLNSLYYSKNMPTYLSTKKLGLNKFRKNIFLPFNDIDIMYNINLGAKVAFINEDIFDDKGLEHFVNKFFINPSNKYLVKGDKVSTYKDQSTIVKYNNAGIFEYTDISVGKATGSSIPQAYRIARNFMLKDTYLSTQEFYLRGYQVSGNEVKFYFNYTFNDFEIILADSIKEQLGVDHPIEISVTNGKVKHYKRWMLDKELYLFNYKEIITNYMEILDNFYENHEYKDIIDNMFLAYYVGDIDEGAKMCWIVDADKRYILDFVE